MTIFRTCHHQKFDCPVGVWVIEQRAIILSATVRSHNVIHGNVQAGSMVCFEHWFHCLNLRHIIHCVIKNRHDAMRWYYQFGLLRNNNSLILCIWVERLSNQKPLVYWPRFDIDWQFDGYSNHCQSWLVCQIDLAFNIWSLMTNY